MTKKVSLPIPFKLITYDTVDSTNEEAKRLARDGVPDGVVVWAKEQSSGTGRRGRKWTSEIGNLYFSILLRPKCSAFKAMQLSFLASLCIAESITDVLPETAIVNCKWPNDVLVEERKISGILLESQSTPQGNTDWMVIGIGLNVRSFPKDVEFPATSLINEGAKNDISAEIMLELFSHRFLSNYKIWKEMGFKPIREAWLCRVAWLGKKIIVHLEHETLVGEFKALDKDGTLILFHNGDERRITAGDIFV
jgi:BirA family transcriptional regulator, biotin operon repressor / biotin---[acetyl-CoA-carboxylase] ligase